MLNFCCIGAQKSGTTWLHNALRPHPDIFFPGGKEVHFWDNIDTKPIAWYQELFAKPINPDIKLGDITPAYAILPEATVARIRDYSPELRIIILLRNPIERAWSAALMALNRAEMTIDEASDQWFIDHFRSQGSMKRGDYETCIRTWRTQYSEEQIQITRYENIAKNPLRVLESCLNHIGVEPNLYPDSRKAELANPVFKGPGHKIRPALRDTLLEIYRPRIANLAKYLGNDFSDWLKE